MLTNEDLQAIKSIIKDEVSPLQKDMKIVKKDLASTRNDVKVLIAYFNRDYVNLRKRIEALEEHLGISHPH